MSEFSDLLAAYIRRKNARVYALADYCGMDRSMLYKIVHGKRVLSSIKTLDQISEFLHLTPAQRRELFTAYQISQEGRDNYYRRRDILRFLSDFKAITDPGVPLLPPRMPAAANDSLVCALTTASEVNQAVYALVALLASDKKGRLCILAPPEFPSLIRLLTSLMKEEDAVIIEHIMCLNDSEQVTSDKKDYNLHCLEAILPLCSCGCSYRPYYYYDNISSRLDTFRLFPYLLLTESGAVVLSETFEAGFLTRQPALLELLHSIFSGYLEQAHPLLQTIRDVSAQLSYVQAFLQADAQAEYSFQMIPCMTDLLTEDSLEKYITHDLPDREAFLHQFMLHVLHTRERHQKRKPTLLFSLEGVKEFLDTGYFEEYPSDIYRPPAPADRLKLIAQFIEQCRRGFYRIRMLKHSIGTVRHGANIYITPKAGYLLFMPVGSSTPVYLNIQESGLTCAFWDFFETMHEDLYYTRQEALARLEDLIARYRRGL